MKHRKLALFGPPGIGKSTIVNYLHTTGVKALDLEVMWHIGEQKIIDFLIANPYDIVGAAGFQPGQLAELGYLPVLLITQERIYKDRRRYRDYKNRAKASQPQHKLADWMSSHDWQATINVTKFHEAIRQIVRLRNGTPLHMMRKNRCF